MTLPALLLVNLGTPDAPQTPEVRRYLREFLSDPLVIDIHPVARWLLVNCVISPFRSPKSAAAYRQVWTDAGSPLLVHGLALRDRARDALGADVPVELGMRYGNPSIRSALDALRSAGARRVVVFPLFPQYSESAFESAVREVRLHADGLDLALVPPFYDHPGFIAAMAAVARPELDEFGPDRVLMSFHGLPERHVIKTDRSGGAHCLRSGSCCDRIVDANRDCYRAQSFATARALAAELELAPESWEVAFQSRLGRTPWIRPFTDFRVRELAEAGVRRLAVLSPSFTADCLETLEEIAIRARADFRDAGGEELLLVPTVNSHPSWVEGLLRIAADLGTL